MPAGGITSIIKDWIWLISSVVGSLVGVGGGLLAIGKWKATLAKKEDLEEVRLENQNGLQEIQNDMERRLYDKYGRTIFMPRKECGQHNDDFRDDLRRELSEIKEGQEKLQNKYEEIYQFIGEVRAHLNIRQ